MESRRKVNKENLRLLCWQAGYHGVAGLARAIGRNRVTLHNAVARPELYGPTYRLIEKAVIK